MLTTITLDMVAHFFLKCKDYETAYREGHSCNTVDKAVKQYKSHRRAKLSLPFPPPHSKPAFLKATPYPCSKKKGFSQSHHMDKRFHLSPLYHSKQEQELYLPPNKEWTNCQVMEWSHIRKRCTVDTLLSGQLWNQSLISGTFQSGLTTGMAHFSGPD
ncbi:MAG: hypothetical protein A6F71_10130 [Cycloclasticus sp. symbiont of Poecilosclerida sp. M]|nr:MAG: hypothetical protein A6F71_10130 [Cycloclasticus sp. symbiont of Poecilosclerida sp. M]